MSDIDRIEAVPVYCPTCEGSRLPLVNARGEVVCAGERHVIGALFDWYTGDHEYDGTEDMPEIDLDGGGE